MDLKLWAIYECYFNTEFIPEIDLFKLHINAPLHNVIIINDILNGKVSEFSNKELSDFIAKYTTIE